MASSAQALPVEQNMLKTDQDIPRIDLEKIDNIPYYVES